MEEKADASKSLLVVLNDEMAIEFLDLGAMGRRNTEIIITKRTNGYLCVLSKSKPTLDYK